MDVKEAHLEYERSTGDKITDRAFRMAINNHGLCSRQKNGRLSVSKMHLHTLIGMDRPKKGGRPKKKAKANNFCLSETVCRSFVNLSARFAQFKDYGEFSDWLKHPSWDHNQTWAIVELIECFRDTFQQLYEETQNAKDKTRSGETNGKGRSPQCRS